MWTQALLAILAIALPIPTQSSTELRRSYDDALRIYNQDPTGKTHPIRAYWPRLQPFADQGDTQALIVLFESLSKAFDDPAETRKHGVRVFEKILSAKLDEETELAVLSKLNRQIDALQEDLVVDLGQLAFEKGNSEQTRAQGLFVCAWARSQKGTTTDPARLEEARELMNSILMEYPNTPAGTRAASEIFKTTNQSYLDAQWQWVKSVRELQAAGKPPTEWPELPLESFRPLFVPLARAKFQPAMKWLRDLYPAFERARRTGNTGQGLLDVVQTLEGVYPVKSMEVAELRLAMLSVLYLQYPSEDWVLASLQQVATMAEYYPQEPLRKLVAELAEKSTNPEIRARALNLWADSLATSSRVEDDAQAIAIYERVLAEFPKTEVGATLKGRLERLRRTMPGSPAPGLAEADEQGKDVTLADYHGRVVVLEFHQLKDEASLAAAPSRGELAKAMEGRPFSLLVVRVGTAVAKKIEEYHASYGVPLRSVVIDMRDHPLLKQWMVRRFPTTYVIDAEGTIRGRDLPWDEARALVEKLVAEAEAKKPAK